MEPADEYGIVKVDYIHHTTENCCSEDIRDMKIESEDVEKLANDQIIELTIAKSKGLH